MGFNDMKSSPSKMDKEVKRGLRASIHELYSRDLVVDQNSSKRIHRRDVDNLYPQRIEMVINNSPTGRRCANLMAKYLVGGGASVNFKIGSRNGKDYYINDLLRSCAHNVSKQYGIYIKNKYVLDVEAMTGSDPIFKPVNVHTLDYVRGAISAEDDAKNAGKIYMLKSDEDGNLQTSDDNLSEWYYPFNRDNKVILAQMISDCREKNILEPSMEDLIRNYRGQVQYVNLTPDYIYALPLADAVYNDLDTEYRIGLYNNTQTRTGFLGKTIIVKFEGDEDDDEEFEEDVTTFLGSENSSSVFVVEVPADSGVKLEDSLNVKQLEPQFDDKLFAITLKEIRTNILGAFNNIPEGLIFAGSGAMFGTQEGTYKAMQDFYWDQNDYERSVILDALKSYDYSVEILPF